MMNILKNLNNKNQECITSIFDEQIPEEFIKPFSEVQENISNIYLKFTENMKLFINLFIKSEDKLN